MYVWVGGCLCMCVCVCVGVCVCEWVCVCVTGAIKGPIKFKGVGGI